MTAAHELVERGYRVTVYEARACSGGKARSMPVPGTARGGRAGLPGEHGFRFFASFYKHVPDTMERIPFGTNPRGVLDNLVTSERTRLASVAGPNLDFQARLPRSQGDFESLISLGHCRSLGIEDSDYLHVARLGMVFLGSCPERRLNEYENITWWRFIDAERRSQAFRSYFGGIGVRAFVAMRPEVASLRTVGCVGTRIWLDHFRPGVRVARLLDGPTNERWIDPWKAHLEQLGVTFRYGTRLARLSCDRRRITSATVRTSDGLETVNADHYVSALPVDKLLPLLDDDLRSADPALDRLKNLETAWMVGAQFYLRRDVPLTRGHLVLVDAPWALTLISQPQFWQGSMSRYGDGTVRGLLSLDLSDWETPGTYVKKPARECSREEIRYELWSQMKAHFNRDEELLRDEDLVTWYLADSIEYEGRYSPVDREPLLTNTAGSWWNRPEAASAIENLFLAGDFVRTNTDLATMEGANESARRAVNAILDRSGNGASRCPIWKMEEVTAFAPLRAIDRIRYHRGLPPIGLTAREGAEALDRSEARTTQAAVLRAAEFLHEALSNARDAA